MDNDKASAMIRSLHSDIETMLQLQVYTAQIIRARYNALTKEGFSEAQALELCKVPLFGSPIK